MRRFLSDIPSVWLLVTLGLCTFGCEQPKSDINAPEWRGSRAEISWSAIQKISADDQLQKRYPIANAAELVRKNPANGMSDGFSFVLAPESAMGVVGATPQIDEWQSQSEQRAVSDCVNGYCIIVVPALITGWRWLSRDVGAKGLAACEVATVADKRGVPVHCSILYLTTDTDRYVAVKAGPVTAEAMVGRPDFDLRLVGTNVEIPELLRVSKAGLESKPLDLTVGLQNQFALGVTDIDGRPSVIFPGYREIVTVRVDMVAAPSAVCATISTNLLLNRQNTAAPTDWHMPSWEQQSSYVAAVKTALKSQFERTCQSPRWDDDKTLMCDESSLHFWWRIASC
jgi:hypothetical protein